MSAQAYLASNPNPPFGKTGGLLLCYFLEKQGRRVGKKNLKRSAANHNEREETREPK